MRTATLRIMCFCLCLVTGPVVKAAAQAPPPPGSPSGPGGPGGPGAPTRPGGTTGPAPNGSPSPGGTPNRGTTTARNALQFGPVGRWWDNRSVVQQIGLRKDQQRRMDAIFNENKPAIIENYKNFLKAQSNLEALNKSPQADKTSLFAAIDVVNSARSSLQKATSAMLLQIRQQMDSDQITKLEKLQ